MNDLNNLYETESFMKSLAAEYVREEGAELQRMCAELTHTRTEIGPENEPDEFTIARMDAKMHAALLREKVFAKRRKRIATWGAIAASLLVVVFTARIYFNSFEDEMNYSQSGGIAGVADMATESPSDMAMPETENIVTQDSDFMAAPSAVAPPPSNAAGGWAADGGMAEDEADEAEEDVSLSRTFAFVSLTAPAGWRIVYVDHDGDVDIFHLESNTGNTVVVLAGAPIYDPEDGEFREIFINETPAYMLVESTHSILFFDMDGFQFVLSTAYDYEDLITLAGHWI